MFLWIGEEYCKKTARTEQNFPTILPDSVEKEKKNDTKQKKKEKKKNNNKKGRKNNTLSPRMVTKWSKEGKKYTQGGVHRAGLETVDLTQGFLATAQREKKPSVYKWYVSMKQSQLHGHSWNQNQSAPLLGECLQKGVWCALMSYPIKVLLPGGGGLTHEAQ